MKDLKNTKLKIFVSAYACEPGLGSEIGVGWHWVLEMSKYFELWVLTRKCNRHTIEPWIKEHPVYGSIHFLYYDWPKWARFWKKGLRGVRTYYNIWQVCANGMVKRTMRENNIKIFHHLTYGNVLWKVSSYGQKQFFIWGPVGGLETIPAEYAACYGRKSRLIESLRRIVVKLLPLNISFQTRCRRADLILCKTDVTRQAIPANYRDKAVLFTDVAVEERQEEKTTSKKDVSHKTIHFLTVGRLDAWRGFDLIIEAMFLAVKHNKRIKLTIVGKGMDETRLRRLIAMHQLEAYVEMTGAISMGEYKERLSATDSVINAALKEAAVTVSFDCLAQSKPLICIDTTGYTRYFSEEYAVVIPQDSREQTITRLSEAILRMTDSTERERLSKNAQQVAKRFTWEKRGKEIKDIIEKKYEHKYAVDKDS